jgi:hypothetical protein
MTAIFRSLFALAAAAPLLNCQAQADDQDRYRAIDEAVRNVMCATDENDRATAVRMLADAVEGYQPRNEDDSGASAVGVSIDAFSRDACQPGARTADGAQQD